MSARADRSGTTTLCDGGHARQDGGHDALDKVLTPLQDDPLAPVIVETHISRLFFVADQVIKIKLPVTTAFIDLSTVALRRVACHREVDLNRRLAPDVYLGVLDISMDGGEVEHAVLMRRLPEARRLSNRLDEPGVTDELERIAASVIELHVASRRGADIDSAASLAAVRSLWSEGIEQLRVVGEGVLETDDIDRLELLAQEYLDGRTSLFDDRLEQGAACDGHGDLQAEDIFCLDDGPRILDCLEFDDRLRFGDRLNDVAFLAMDLGRLGHPELGETFLAHYRRLSGDEWPDSLARHFMAYRAHVRSKVACIRHLQHGQRADADAARSLHAQALELLAAGRITLVLVGGSPGTGKSTLSRSLATRLGAERLSTDELRDELFPVNAGEGAEALHTGRYDAASVDAVYRKLIERAGDLLAKGRSVVADGSWLHDEHRRSALERATEAHALAIQLRCTCSPEVAEARIARRAARGDDASEATVEVGRALRSAADPWPAAREIDTGTDPDTVVTAARIVRSAITA